MTGASQNTTLVPSDAAALSLVSALERFFKMAAFYPPDHGQCQTALTHLRQTLAAVVPTGEALVLETRAEELLVQGVPLALDNKAAASLHHLLDSLDLARLVLHRSSPLAQMHRMVQTFNALKLESESSRDFHELDFSSLPSLVSVTLREFTLADGSTKGAQTEGGDAVETLWKLVDQQEWDSDVKADFKASLKVMVEKVTRQLAEDPALAGEDPRKLLATGLAAIQKGISAPTKASGPVETQSLCQGAALALSHYQDSQVTRLMFSILSSDSSADTKAPPHPTETNLVRDPADYSLSLPEMLERVGKDSRARGLDLEGRNTAAEEIFFLYLDLLARHPNGPLQSKAEFKLKGYLVTPLTDEKYFCAERAILAVLTEGKQEVIDGVLPVLLPTMVPGSESRCSAFLERLVTLDGGRLLPRAWPHLVCLLLSSCCSPDSRLYSQIQQFIVLLPPARRLAESQRLNSLPDIYKGKLNHALLQMPLDDSREILMTLLGSKMGPTLGSSLFSNWSKQGPQTLTGLTTRILGPYERSHGEIYRHLLLADSSPAAAHGFREMMEPLVLSRLISLPRQQRTQSWVFEAIKWLNGGANPQTQDFLDQIRRQKVFLFFPAWPAACRLAARSNQGPQPGEGPPA